MELNVLFVYHPCPVERELRAINSEYLNSITSDRLVQRALYYHCAFFFASRIMYLMVAYVFFQLEKLSDS